MWIDVDQNTEEWDLLRSKKATSSNFAKIMANDGKAFGEPAKAYAAKIATSRFIDGPVSSGFSNAAMARGHELEPIAINEYENQYFVDVTKGGFYDCGEIGGSPDGRVGKDGLVEVKSQEAHVHYASIKRGSYSPAYKWQFVGNLLVSGRDWIDYISFCVDIPTPERLFVCRMYSSHFSEDLKRLESRLKSFEELVCQCLSDIKENPYFIVHK